MGDLKKAVVTGAAGFIGKVLTKRLVETGWKTVALVHRSPPQEVACESYFLDIREKGVLERYLDSKTVLFHLAAKANISASVTDPRTDFESGTVGLFEVLESARKKGCRVIFPSTGSIFDPSNSQPVSEKSFVRPSSPYGATKVSGEAYCAAYFRSYELDTRIARLFSVYGIGMRQFVIFDLFQKIMRNPQELVLLGDGRQVRDYLYVDDVVEGLLKIASQGQPGEDYNVASGEPTCIIDLAKQIASLLGFPNIRITITGKHSPGEVPSWYSDIGKIRQIGFSPTIPLKEGLERTVAWLKKKPDSPLKTNKYLLVSPDYPPPFVGGSLVYMHSLVENCPESLYILTAPLPKGLSEVTSPRHNVIRSRFLVGSHNPSRWSLFCMYGYLIGWVFVKNLFRRYNAVIVNPGVVGNSLLILLLKLFQTSVIGIGYAEEMSTVLKGSGLKNSAKRTLMKTAYRHGNGFIAVSNFAKDTLSSIDVPPERIRIIPPPYYGFKLGCGIRKKQGGHHVLSVGRLIPRKGFGYLLEAVGLLKKEITDIRLTIVGGGDERERLEKMIQSLGLSETVDLRGEVSDEELRNLYSTCNLFVLANVMLENGDCEGAPLVFAEAGSFATPMIGGLEGGQTMIRNGENGFLVNPRNVPELAAKIREILLNQELGRALGEGGLRKVCQDHDPVKAGLFFLKVIQEFS